MTINLSGLSQAASALTALSGVAMVTPEYVGYSAQRKDGSLEQNPMLFHIEADNSLSLTSDITDHATEDNSVINDQIANKPEIVTVRGYIGELNTVLPRSLQIAREAQEKLILVSGYVPELTVGALRALNAAEQAYRLSENIQSQFSEQFNGVNVGQNEQQAFIQRWYSYWRRKTLFTVQTPWMIFNDMAIMTLKGDQGEDTETMSEFTITFKKMRFASAIFQNESEASGRSANQSAPLVDNGLRAGQETNVSFGSLLA